MLVCWYHDIKIMNSRVVDNTRTWAERETNTFARMGGYGVLQNSGKQAIKGEPTRKN